MAYFDSSNSKRNAFAGGIKYDAPAFNLGGGAINGGYSFDLPLATVANFNQQALTFSANNTTNAQGFLAGVMGNSQANVTRVSDTAFAFGGQALTTIEKINASQQNSLQYVAKKMSPRGCFITTAICQADGKPDDCDELTILRSYRDNVLMRSVIGKEAIAEYYAIAPKIVEAIDSMSNALDIYNFLKHAYLLPSIVAARNGDNVEVFALYNRMVKVARAISGV